MPECLPPCQALRVLRGVDLHYAKEPPSAEELQRARITAAALAPVHRWAMVASPPLVAKPCAARPALAQAALLLPLGHRLLPALAPRVRRRSRLHAHAQSR